MYCSDSTASCLIDLFIYLYVDLFIYFRVTEIRELILICCWLHCFVVYFSNHQTRLEVAKWLENENVNVYIHNYSLSLRLQALDRQTFANNERYVEVIK